MAAVVNSRCGQIEKSVACKKAKSNNASTCTGCTVWGKEDGRGCWAVPRKHLGQQHRRHFIDIWPL